MIHQRSLLGDVEVPLVSTLCLPGSEDPNPDPAHTRHRHVTQDLGPWHDPWRGRYKSWTPLSTQTPRGIRKVDWETLRSLLGPPDPSRDETDRLRVGRREDGTGTCDLTFRLK